MKKLRLREMALIVFVSLAWSVTTWADESHLDFVGLSQGPARGDTGIIGLHRLCHATFPGSRMCTSRDIQLSVNPPAIKGSGWVQPVYVPYHSEPGVFDISGAGLITKIQLGVGEDFTTPRNLSCSGWASQIGFGLSLSGGASSQGSWNIMQCDFRSRVACCGSTEDAAADEHK